jgi:uncharacterized membrane protein YphA (DoxX/SURF4 family)
LLRGGSAAWPSDGNWRWNSAGQILWCGVTSSAQRSLNWLLVPLFLFFGGLWVFAAWKKLYGMGPLVFVDDIRSFHILGDPWAALLAITLPWLEMLCGLCVILGILHRGALVLLNFSLVVFLVAIISTWVRGIDISCGCFGKSLNEATHLELVVRDVALLALGIFLHINAGRYRPWSFLSGSRRHSPPQVGAV